MWEVKNLNNQELVVVLKRLGACTDSLNWVRSERHDAKHALQALDNADLLDWLIKQAEGMFGLPAWAEYLKVKAAAWAEYLKVQAAAWAEYEKVQAPAWAEYEKVQAAAWAEYEKVQAAAWAEYEKVKAPAWAEYEKVQAPAWAEYEKVQAAAWAEYLAYIKSQFIFVD